MKTNRLILSASLLAMSIAAMQTYADAVPEVASAPYITAALADPFRHADMVADSSRRGGEMAEFSGIKPGQNVVEFVPGSGYFTRLFSAIVGLQGKVYALWPQEYTLQLSSIDKMKSMVKQDHYHNVEVVVQPIGEMSVPKQVDVVFTSMNYHDVPDEEMNHTDPSVLNRQVFNMLKPGGAYIVFDHAAEAGSNMRDTETLHRIDPAIVRKQVDAAGFIFEAENKAFRNSDDPHRDRSFEGPLRGHTDRFFFRFRKPGVTAAK